MSANDFLVLLSLPFVAALTVILVWIGLTIVEAYAKTTWTRMDTMIYRCFRAIVSR